MGQRNIEQQCTGIDWNVDRLRVKGEEGKETDMFGLMVRQTEKSIEG